MEAPPNVAIAISRIANDEARALYVKQPYKVILNHLRSQWKFHNCPPRAGQGEKEGDPKCMAWDVSPLYS